MKGIIETSVYLVIFALVCFFSIDFIRIFLIVNYQRKLEIRSFMC